MSALDVCFVFCVSLCIPYPKSTIIFFDPGFNYWSHFIKNSCSSMSAIFEPTELVSILVSVSCSSPSSSFLLIQLIHMTGSLCFDTQVTSRIHVVCKMVLFVFVCVCPQFSVSSYYRLKSMTWTWCVCASRFTCRTRAECTTPCCPPSSPTPSMTTVSRHTVLKTRSDQTQKSKSSGS